MLPRSASWSSMRSLRYTGTILLSAIQLALTLIIARPLNHTAPALSRPSVDENGFTRCYENEDKYPPVTMRLCIPLFEVMIARPDFKYLKSYSANPYQNVDFAYQSCVVSLIPGQSRGVITISLLSIVEGALGIFKVCETVGRGGEEELRFGWHLGVAKYTAPQLPSPAALELGRSNLGS